jgi:hypothetical protein
MADMVKLKLYRNLEGRERSGERRGDEEWLLKKRYQPQRSAI